MIPAGRPASCCAGHARTLRLLSIQRPRLCHICVDPVITSLTGRTWLQKRLDPSQGVIPYSLPRPSPLARAPLPSPICLLTTGSRSVLMLQPDAARSCNHRPAPGRLGKSPPAAGSGSFLADQSALKHPAYINKPACFVATGLTMCVCLWWVE